jgi:methionine synthase II (cobalamin-independent)
MSSSPSTCSAIPGSTAISSNTTVIAPAASSRSDISPKGDKQLVLGLVTSKSGALEKKDDIKRRIDEASKYVALDQLCLSPQCGFASTEEGNVLSEDEQWAKLRMVVETAEEVWG